MELSEGRRRSIRVRALVLGAVLLAATSATACGPPHRVHTGPVPVQLFSWEMGRNLPVYTGITDDVLAWEPSNGRGLTLVACHPPGSLRYRLVVHAELTA